MDHFFHFFAQPDASLPVVKSSYNLSMVLLSLFVPILMSIMALYTAQLTQKTDRSRDKKTALFLGAIALGLGVWAMHFIGMMALILPAPVHYNASMTLLSIVPAIGSSWVALSLLSQASFSWGQLSKSGIVVGLGIGAMHYIGMSAMRLPLSMHHEVPLFILSILIAILLAMLALWIRFRLATLALPQQWRLVLSGLVMGCAISSMHYTGMVGVKFYGYGTLPKTSIGFWVPTELVALGLSSLVLTIGMSIVVLNSLIRSQKLYQEMQANKSRLAAILDTVVDPIITIDAYGAIQDFNQAAEQFFGYQPKEVLGKNVKILMPEPYQSEHDNYLKNYRTTTQAKIIGIGREVQARTKAGSVIPIRLAVGRVPNQQDEQLFVGVITDISKRQKLEQSLRDSVQRAEQAALTKSQFLANMSHEIRTPMNSIIGFSELLLQTNLTTEQRSYLNTVAQSSHSLLRLINDILDSTKMEAGKLALEITHFSLKSVAMHLHSSLRLTAQKANVELKIEYPEPMPDYYQGDSLRLIQVLTNLIDNAIKFTNAGGQVLVTFSYHSGQVYIKIQDSGIGMSTEQLKTVFDAFTQADASINRRFGGTGLGTTIARQIVHNMQGHIEVESTLGQGSIFTISLPLPLGEKPQAATDTQPLQLPPLHVLIVDDVDQNLRLLKILLEANGHTVECAHDGNEAIHHYHTQHFDVILMDMHMPGTDGLQATQIIRQLEREKSSPPTPIIALTASVMQTDRQQARSVGMDGFAAKPLNASDLFAEIARVLLQPLCSIPPQKTTPSHTSQSQYNINWSRGVQLWGQRCILIQEISRFLKQEQAYMLLYQTQAQTLDDSALLFHLHRLHGTTANLALDKLSSQLHMIESLLRQGHSEQARRLLPSIQVLIEEVHSELNITPNSETAEADLTLPTFNLTAQHDAFQKLLASLRRNEWNANAVEQVYELLNPYPRKKLQLQQALDAFNFDEACHLLTQWSHTAISQ